MRDKYFVGVILAATLLTLLWSNYSLISEVKTLKAQVAFAQPENIAAIEAKLEAIPVLTTEVDDLQKYDINLAKRMGMLEESHKQWNDMWKEHFSKR